MSRMLPGSPVPQLGRAAASTSMTWESPVGETNVILKGRAGELFSDMVFLLSVDVDHFNDDIAVDLGLAAEA